ncbi:hypothetical protein ABBQ32_008872 [Trebouxia sp. C0010 RCD-2024]
MLSSTHILRVSYSFDIGIFSSQPGLRACPRARLTSNRSCLGDMEALVGNLAVAGVGNTGGEGPKSPQAKVVSHKQRCN